MNAAFFSSEQQLLAQQLGGYMVLVVPGANGAAPTAFAPLAKQHLPTSSDGTISRPASSSGSSSPSTVLGLEVQKRKIDALALPEGTATPPSKAVKAKPAKWRATKQWDFTPSAAAVTAAPTKPARPAKWRPSQTIGREAPEAKCSAPKPKAKRDSMAQQAWPALNEQQAALLQLQLLNAHLLAQQQAQAQQQQAQQQVQLQALAAQQAQAQAAQQQQQPPAKLPTVVLKFNGKRQVLGAPAKEAGAAAANGAAEMLKMLAKGREAHGDNSSSDADTSDTVSDASGEGEACMGPMDALSQLAACGALIAERQ